MSRAQSTVIGTIMLVAVVVVTLTIFGTFSFASVTDSGEEPVVEVTGTLDSDGLTISHAGGDSLAIADLTIHVSNASTKTVWTFGDGTVSGDGDDQFDPGERWSNDSALPVGDRLTVVVVDESANAVLFRGETTLQTTVPPPPTPPGTPTATPTGTPPGTPTPTPAPTPTPTSTPVPSQPQLSSVSVSDDTQNDNGRLQVSYEVSNTATFDHVAVDFDNRQRNWADATGQNNSRRGTVRYVQGGVQGDTYDVTVRAYDTSGQVTDTRTMTVVANGEDPESNDDLGESGAPTLAGAVVDDVSAYQADFEVSYDVTNRSDFSHVRVEIENLDSGGADATYTSTDPRNNVEDYAEADYGGTLGDSYRVTIQVIDDDGLVVDERVVTDTADGTDPSGNDDLSRASSPTLVSCSVQDKSKRHQGAWYDVRFDASGGAEFDHVEVQFRNRDSPYASAWKQGGGNGRVSYRPGWGHQDRYVISIRVVDTDGIVVDERIVTDSADGNDP